MKISRFKEIVKEVLVEDNEYQAFFQKCLDKAGKSIPQMGTQEKRDFFNKIDAAWKGRGEKSEALVGNQHKLDVDNDGEIEASDLKKLRSESINEIDYKEALTKFNKQLENNSQVKTIANFYNKSIKDIVKQLQSRIKVLRYSDKSIKLISINFTDDKSKTKVHISQTYTINEDAKKVWKKGKGLFVDSDFVNFSKGKLDNSELKHAGMGDFFLDTPNGKVYFIRTSDKFDGMSGRAHRITDNEQNGKLIAQLIKKMGAKIVKES
jgi:hypothetical protein